MRRLISKAGTEAGYTYVAMLVVLVVVALGAQAARIPSESARISDREAELLFRGEAYRAAIASFWSAGDPPAYPRRLSDLISDPRDHDRRHLRRLYPDPMTGGDWRLIRHSDGTISGVRSASDAVPRRRFFPGQKDDGFADARSHGDWEFVFEPETP